MTSPIRQAARRASYVGGVLVRRARSTVAASGEHPADPAGPSSGWLVVTVLREPAEMEAGNLPEPLAELGDRIEVRLRPAPGNRGTELAARLHDGTTTSTEAERLTGTDAQAELRSALRRAKQLLEVGEVLAVDPTPHGERTATPGGALLEAWTTAAPKGGVR